MVNSKTKLTPEGIYNEYQKGVSYNQSIELYEKVRKNENFFIGNQWEGVDAPDLDKPVFNILKRVCNMFISQIVSDDISASATTFTKKDGAAAAMKIVSGEIERAIEYSRAKQKNRRALRNACVDGDACIYAYFNPSKKTGQIAKGLIDIEVIDNTNVIFDNTASSDVQSQGHIILALRKKLDEVISEARKNGIDEKIISQIKPDSESELDDERDDCVTVLIRFWKENGSVYCSKSTKDVFIKQPFDTFLSLYPVAFMNWESVKNSYHGQAAVTELLPNQIFVNKCYAMGMDYVKKMAFPKLIYDKNRFPNGFSNRIGEAVKIEGGVNDAVATAFKMPDMSGSVMELVEKTMVYTKEYMGASDAALGNVRPDNAAAIIALQKASNAPLELIRQSFYQFVEDYIRIFVDIMRAYYGVREVNDEDGNIISFDFASLNDYDLNLNVNVGASAYWSEIMQVQTADNLYASGIIKDAELYLNSIPDAYIKNKQKIIQAIRMDKQKSAADMAAMQ
ncbi:MAG: hypothetical protein E7410_00890 [Ruminococcaceae bacterium]|nr:hypothetical protein [Oscillospiraceae bacterium]